MFTAFQIRTSGTTSTAKPSSLSRLIKSSSQIGSPHYDKNLFTIIDGEKNSKLITENLIDYTRKNILGKYADLQDFLEVWHF